MKTLKKFDLNNIDKSKWRSFPFEKIAFRIAETVNPNTTELEIYYGLEHLDADSLHIRRNGVPSDVSGGKLKCYPGDIIFGKRRAYQRKAGIVKEAGICSAHSFVFRANEEIIDVRLFPFFLHSDQFMHKMIDISVGGLSPTINWSDLKHQEFLLPPKEQQAKLADLLWAMDEVIEKDLEVFERLERLIVSSRSNFYKNYNGSSVKLSEIIFDQSKISNDSLKNEDINSFGKYCVVDQSKELIAGYSDNESLVNKNLPVILFGDHTTIIKFIDFPFITGADGTKLIKPKIDINLKFLFHQILYLNVQPEGYKRHFGILKDKFVMLDDNRNSNIDSFINEMDKLEILIENSKCKLQSSKALLKALIDQVF